MFGRKKSEYDKVVSEVKTGDEIVTIRKSGMIAGYVREKKWPKRSLYGILGACLLIVGFVVGAAQLDWFSGAIGVNTVSTEVIVGMSENLTEQLLSDSIAHQNADEADFGSSLTVMRETAAQRQKYVEMLMKESPDEFLRIAITPDVQNEYLSDVQGVERAVTAEGTLEIFEAFGNRKDGDDLDIHDTWLMLNTGSGESKRIYLPESVPVDFNPNDQIRVTGYELSNVIVPNTIADTNNFVVTAAATLEQPTGTKRQVAIILVNVDDATPQSNFTKANAETSMNATDKWYREASFGKVYMAGKDASKSADIYGIYKVTSSSSQCDSNSTTWHTQARTAAAKDGFVASGYQHVVVMMNDTISSGKYSTNCGWSGLGQVGASYSWQFGTTSSLVTIHEMGHNMGLAHAARNYNCKSGSESVAFGGTCTTIEYGDMFDAMGNSSSRGTPAPYFSAVNRSKLGWIPSTNVKTVTASGTYELSAADESSSNTQLIRIPQTYGSTGSVTSYYYLELRKPIGVAANLSATSKADYTGVQLRTGSASTYAYTYLYQLGTISGAETCTGCATGLRPGMVFKDPANPGISIRVTSLTENAATVVVDMSSVPDPTPSCTINNPTITVNPTSGKVTPGGKVDYAVTVKNNNSQGCGSITYTVTPSASTTGLSFSPTNRQWSLTSGSTSSSQTFSTTSSSNLADGTYSVSFRVSNSANSTTVTQNVSFTVARNTTTPVCTRNNPTITVSPTSGRVTPGGKVDYSVTVKSNDSADCSAISYTATPSSSASGFTLSPTNKVWTINPGATSTAQTFSVTSPSSIADGTYSISFRVTNSANSNAVSQNVSFIVASPVPACTRSTPTVTVSPTSGTVVPGGVVEYEVKVLNRDSKDCPNATFTTSAAMSNNSTKGFTFSPSTKSWSLTPGASISEKFKVTAPNVNDGMHTVVFKTTHSADGKMSVTQNVSFIISKGSGGGSGGGGTVTPPSVRLSGLADGSAIGNGNTKITANATNPSGISKIEIYIDQESNPTPVAVCNNPKNGTCEVSIKGQNVKQGPHIIKAYAYGNDANKTVNTASLSFRRD